MKKSKFKKMMKKENKAFRNYYVYELIIILILSMMIVGNVFVTIRNLIPNNITIINSILIVIMAILIIIIDLKNDMDIKKMYQIYKKENKISEYKDKSKYLKVLLVVSLVFGLISGALTMQNILKVESLSGIEDTLTITTNRGNDIVTQYEKFGGFSLKIPTDFHIMSDEILSIKYPNGNPPSLVYTNDDATINVALVMNDVVIKNSEIEEYIKTMESAYKNYSKEVKINFWERNNHKIGEIEFITEAIDTDIYNHIIAFSVDDKLRLVNFNCTREYLNEWKEVSKFILESIIFE